MDFSIKINRRVQLCPGKHIGHISEHLEKIGIRENRDSFNIIYTFIIESKTEGKGGDGGKFSNETADDINKIGIDGIDA